jgi:hypothetical protein
VAQADPAEALGDVQLQGDHDDALAGAPPAFAAVVDPADEGLSTSTSPESGPRSARTIATPKRCSIAQAIR